MPGDPKDETYTQAHTDFHQDLSYGDYLRLDQLLSAQRTLTQAHDEVLFIAIHQVQELWMLSLIHI